MKGKKIVIFAVVLTLVVGIGFGVKYYIELTNYRKAINEITISEVDLSQVPDGVYMGSTDTIWVGATVAVTVENYVITDIVLLHRHDRGVTAEVIPGRVIEEQTLQVDIVSGATSSSKVILKAIENALRDSLHWKSQ